MTDARNQTADPVAAARQPKHRPAPDCWAVVPREATTDQLLAGMKAWQADPERKSSTLYRAMVEAAPAAPTVPFDAADRLREALYRLKTDCELSGLDKQAGWDRFVALANEALAGWDAALATREAVRG